MWLSSLGHIKTPSKAVSGACLDQGAEHDTGAISRSNSQVRARQRGKPTVGMTGSPPKSLQCLYLKGKDDYGFDAWCWSLLVNLSRANKTAVCVLAWLSWVVEKRLAPGTGSWRCLCQVLPHPAPAQSHPQILSIGHSWEGSLHLLSLRLDPVLGWPGQGCRRSSFTSCFLFERDRNGFDWSDTQRSGFEPSLGVYAAAGYLMSASSNRKLKTLKASPASHSEAVI